MIINKQPYVCVRRMIDRHAFGVWFGEFRNNKVAIAKPVHFELVDSPEGYMLPEPTFTISTDGIVDFFKQLSEQLSMNGEPSINPHQVVEAKDANLKDLRMMVDRLFSMAATMNENTRLRAETELLDAQSQHTSGHLP